MNVRSLVDSLHLKYPTHGSFTLRPNESMRKAVSANDVPSACGRLGQLPGGSDLRRPLPPSTRGPARRLITLGKRLRLVRCASDCKGRTMTTSQPLNSGLFKLHRIFYVAIGAFAVIMLVLGIPALIKGGEDAGIGFMGLVFVPIGILHWYAAKGAREGKSYGRILSRIIGTIWLIGFPIGTALGIYTWSQTGSKWRSVDDAPPA